MSFKLSLRSVQSSDLGWECPFLPEEDDYETYFSAFLQDLQSIEGIELVTVADTSEVTVNAKGLDLTGIKAVLKPLLQHYFQSLRLTEVIEVDSSP